MPLPRARWNPDDDPAVVVSVLEHMSSRIEELVTVEDAWWSSATSSWARHVGSLGRSIGGAGVLLGESRPVEFTRRGIRGRAGWRWLPRRRRTRRAAVDRHDEEDRLRHEPTPEDALCPPGRSPVRIAKSPGGGRNDAASRECALHNASTDGRVQTLARSPAERSSRNTRASPGPSTSCTVAAGRYVSLSCRRPGDALHGHRRQGAQFSRGR